MWGVKISQDRCGRKAVLQEFKRLLVIPAPHKGRFRAEKVSGGLAGATKPFDESTVKAGDLGKPAWRRSGVDSDRIHDSKLFFFLRVYKYVC